MDTSRFDAWTRRGFGASVLGLAALAALGRRQSTAANTRKKHKKRRTSQNLCTRTGQTCRRTGNNCRPQFCLDAPFTITAAWTVTGDHDTFLFLPETDETGPAPHIDWECNASETVPCDTRYPFACVDGDSQETGDEVTTIYALLPGRYEYWLELVGNTAAGEVVVTLRDQGGRIVRQWQNPANAAPGDVSWHVFDIDGGSGTAASVDEIIDDLMPSGAHSPNTYVCPM
jgi:hypothetical protein